MESSSCYCWAKGEFCCRTTTFLLTQIDTAHLPVGFAVPHFLNRLYAISVLSLLIVDLNEGYDYYMTFFAGVITVILMQYLHFQSHSHDPDKHAM